MNQFLEVARGGMRREARTWQERSIALLIDMIHMLEERTTFSFARFNDGEVGAITGEMSEISRGQQDVSPSVSRELRKALESAPSASLVGIPCPLCYPKLHRAALALTSESARVGPATALQNGTHRVSAHALTSVLREQPDRELHWVGSEAHRLEPLESRLGRPITHWKVPDEQAFEAALTLGEELIDGLSKEAVVLLSCGPASRVLTIRIARSESGATALDVGSLFDPITREVTHGYHRTAGRLTCPACRGSVHKKHWTRRHDRLAGA
jgi:hypothetical protein